LVPQLYRFRQQYRPAFYYLRRDGEILPEIIALNLLCSPNQSRREILIRFDVLSLLLDLGGLLGHLHPMRRHVNQCRFAVRIAHLPRES